MDTRIEQAHGLGLTRATNRGGRTMKKPKGPIIEVTENTGNSDESSRTIPGSERALNGAILAAEIDRSVSFRQGGVV